MRKGELKVVLIIDLDWTLKRIEFVIQVEISAGSLGGRFGVLFGHRKKYLLHQRSNFNRRGSYLGS